VSLTLIRRATSSQLATMEEPPWARKGRALPARGDEAGDPSDDEHLEHNRGGQAGG
jgi:hypothetical protein